MDRGSHSPPITVTCLWPAVWESLRCSACCVRGPTPATTGRCRSFRQSALGSSAISRGARAHTGGFERRRGPRAVPTARWLERRTWVHRRRSVGPRVAGRRSGTQFLRMRAASHGLRSGICSSEPRHSRTSRPSGAIRERVTRNPLDHHGGDVRTRIASATPCPRRCWRPSNSTLSGPSNGSRPRTATLMPIAIPQSAI